VASSKINFREPWHDFVPGQGEAFLAELRRELRSGTRWRIWSFFLWATPALPTTRFSVPKMAASFKYT